MAAQQPRRGARPVSRSPGAEAQPEAPEVASTPPRTAPVAPVAPHYFATPADFRSWLSEHAATAPELSVGYYKVGCGKPSMTWAESVDEALCFGWIDGVRHRVDDERYRIRFTPRKPASNWSTVNIRRIGELELEGRMTDAGRAAFAARRDDRSNRYTYEERGIIAFTPAMERTFRRRRTAWKHWEQETPSYRKIATYWVVSAKQDATKDRRLAELIERCANGERLSHITPRRRSP